MKEFHLLFPKHCRLLYWMTHSPTGSKLGAPVVGAPPLSHFATEPVATHAYQTYHVLVKCPAWQ